MGRHHIEEELISVTIDQSGTLRCAIKDRLL